MRFTSRSPPAGWLPQGSCQPPTPLWCLLPQLRKGFWQVLELIFLAANGALNTHLGLRASQPTVASEGIFLQ